MNILKVLTKRRILGNFGERAARRYLKRNGYRILKKNFVTDAGEIDIIARKGDITAIVEVKTRTLGTGSITEPRPSASVTKEKQRKLISAAKIYRTQFSFEGKIRFDVIEVYTESTLSGSRVSEIKHLPGAFDFNTAHQKRR